MDKHINDAVVVSCDFSKEGTGVLIVGKINKENGNMGIVNAYEGEEAWDLWRRLTIKKGEPR